MGPIGWQHSLYARTAPLSKDYANENLLKSTGTEADWELIGLSPNGVRSINVGQLDKKQPNQCLILFTVSYYALSVSRKIEKRILFQLSPTAVTEASSADEEVDDRGKDLTTFT